MPISHPEEKQYLSPAGIVLYRETEDTRSLQVIVSVHDDVRRHKLESTHC